MGYIVHGSNRSEHVNITQCLYCCLVWHSKLNFDSGVGSFQAIVLTYCNGELHLGENIGMWSGVLVCSNLFVNHASCIPSLSCLSFFLYQPYMPLTSIRRLFKILLRISLLITC